MTESGFKQIAFDLDDTLLDTTHLLIPKAARDSCRLMIEAGLLTDLDSCLTAREEIAMSAKRMDIYHVLTRKFGVKLGADASAVSEIGRKAFYNRDVDRDISLFNGTEEILKTLKGKYQLNLVTAGHRPTQEAKIRILKLNDYFQSIHHVDPSKNESKGAVFAEILKRSGDEPSQHLSVGNRLDTDIGEARELGWSACWIKHGEHSAFVSASEFEKPDYTITNITELITTCRL